MENEKTLMQRIQECLQEIEAMKKSSHIVFTSPCPCSTERMVKNHIVAAGTHLKVAAAALRQLPTGRC